MVQDWKGTYRFRKNSRWNRCNIKDNVDMSYQMYFQDHLKPSMVVVCAYNPNSKEAEAGELRVWE